jgi:hypothetical protein
MAQSARIEIREKSEGLEGSVLGGAEQAKRAERCNVRGRLLIVDVRDVINKLFVFIDQPIESRSWPENAGGG